MWALVCPLSYGIASPGYVLCILESRGLCNISVGSFAGDSALLNWHGNVVGNKLVARVVKLAVGVQFVVPVLKNRTLDVESEAGDVVIGFNKVC
jgi:hypothetical protein